MDDDSHPETTIKTKAKKTKSPRTLKTKAAQRDSFVESLKNEWNLFWAGFQSDDESAEIAKNAPEKLTRDQIKTIKKSLSDERKRLNQRLESIRKEIDINQAKLESLKIVGGSQEDTLQRLSELNDTGQQISEQLARVDHRLKLARTQEGFLRNELLA